MSTNNKGQGGGIEDIAPRDRGFDVKGDIYQPINPGAGLRLANPLFDFTTEWVCRVQPTPKGLARVFGNTAPFATAKALYQLRANVANGVFGGSTGSRSPRAVRTAAEAKVNIANANRWALVPVVGASFRVIGDKPTVNIGRTSQTSDAALETEFSLSKGRVHYFPDAVRSDDMDVAVAGSWDFEIPPNAVKAEVVGFGAISDYFYRDPANNVFMVGLGAARGINTKFPLHPLALTITVLTTAAAQFFLSYDLEE